MNLAVLADDLTGACDTGVQFVDHEIQVHVCRCLKELDTEEGVLVVSTESRSIAAEVAARVVRDTSLTIAKCGRQLIYKKIDSTLRGNLGAEIDAVLTAGPHQMALVCPAFPSMGRRFVQGQLLVGGTHQCSGRHLPSIVREQSNCNIFQLDITEIHRGTSALIDFLRQLVEDGYEICCADAAEDEDLAVLAEAAIALAPRILPIGSAGLARQLSPRYALVGVDHLGRWKDSIDMLPGQTNSMDLPIVCIAGSRNPFTIRQLACLVSKTDFISVELDNHTPTDLSSAVGKGQHVVIRVVHGDGIQALLTKVMATLAGLDIAGLVLTGGYTAELVCDAAAVSGIELLRQVLPGLAEGRIIGGRLEGTSVVTKAGGFGDENALLDVVYQLTRCTLKL